MHVIIVYDTASILFAAHCTDAVSVVQSTGNVWPQAHLKMLLASV